MILALVLLGDASAARNLLAKHRQVWELSNGVSLRACCLIYRSIDICQGILRYQMATRIAENAVTNINGRS